MKRIGLIFFIWFCVLTLGVLFTYCFLYFIILGLLSAFLSDDFEWQSFKILYRLTFEFSIPALVIYFYFIWKETKSEREIWKESSGIIIVLIFLTFLIISGIFQSFGLFLCFIPFVMATLTFFGITKYFLKNK